jgi:hypothetical protein
MVEEEPGTGKGLIRKGKRKKTFLLFKKLKLSISIKIYKER